MGWVFLNGKRFVFVNVHEWFCVVPVKRSTRVGYCSGVTSAVCFVEV